MGFEIAIDFLIFRFILREEISDRNYKLVPEFLAITLDCIMMQIRKEPRKVLMGISCHPCRALYRLKLGDYMVFHPSVMHLKGIDVMICNKGFQFNLVHMQSLNVALNLPF